MPKHTTKGAPVVTGRERLTAVLRKQPKDRLPWTTLVDNATLGGLPETLRGNWGIDFYRHLGCDVFLLNGWGTPHSFRSPELRWPNDVRVCREQDGGRTVTQWETPLGTLTGVRDRGHPVKYPVDSLEAVRIFRQMWEGASFVEHDDSPVLAALNTLVGDDGVVTRFWGPSTIPRLLEEDMGTENFYYLMFDYPADMKGLIETIHERELEAFRILARGPCESVTLCENTSTYYISPEIYRQYNMPHQRDFVERVKAAGKTAILHMCGHVRDILPLIKETGCDGIHALTPPPTGNTPFEVALDVLGEDLIILGSAPPASDFLAGDIRRIAQVLDRLITPRLRQANFILGLGADGISVPLERFEAVKQWMAKRTQGDT